jgi:hypothetical protein
MINPQIANFLGVQSNPLRKKYCSVSDPDPHWFASNFFYLSKVSTGIFSTTKCQKSSLNLNEGATFVRRKIMYLRNIKSGKNNLRFAKLIGGPPTFGYKYDNVAAGKYIYPWRVAGGRGVEGGGASFLCNISRWEGSLAVFNSIALFQK